MKRRARRRCRNGVAGGRVDGCRARGREAQPTGDDILEVVPGVEDAEQPAGDAPLVRLDAGVVELDRAQTFVAASRGVDILALLFLAAGAEQRRVDMGVDPLADVPSARIVASFRDVAKSRLKVIVAPC